MPHRSIVAWVWLALAACGGCAARTANPLVLEDARLVVQVKTAIVNDPEVGTRPVEVHVADGVVRLTGSVRSALEVERVMTLVRAVPGVRDVRSELVVVAVATPAPDPGPTARATPPGEWEDDRRLLAVGLTMGWSDPRREGLGARPRAGPLVRLGRGRGFGPTFGLSWFNAPVSGPRDERYGRLTVHPFMAGVSYTLDRARWSSSFSMVAGPAFNGYELDATGPSEGVVVGVGNSLALRPGVSVWYEASRRIAVNALVGYVVTRPRATVVNEGRLVERSLRADTTVVQFGLAYKLF